MPVCGVFPSHTAMMAAGRGGACGAYRRSGAEAAARADSRARRLAAHEDVRRRHPAGETPVAIGRATGLARATAHKYAYAESFPERAVRRPNPSRLDPYLACLEGHMAGGRERDGAPA